jgi:glycosyltransferase involved in cell wall biosynthesis
MSQVSKTGSLPVTVLILTKNEELAIESCIKSVQSFHQVIVVDSGSTDNTKIIAESYGAQTVDFTWNRKYPKKKQWSMELSVIQNDWVLFLDADEIVSKELVEEINNELMSQNDENIVAFEIPILYSFMGKFLNHGHKVKKISLVNRKYCNFPVLNDLHVANMWEVEGHYQPIYQGRLGKLSSSLKHLDPDPLYDYFARHNRYSDWESELAVDLNLSLSVLDSRSRQGKFFNRLPFKPIIFFIYSYFIRRGLLDGRAGFNYAVALSFYYWQISIKTSERRGFA